MSRQAAIELGGEARLAADLFEVVRAHAEQARRLLRNGRRRLSPHPQQRLGIQQGSTATQQAHALQEWYLQPPGTGPWDWSYFTTVNFANSSDGTDGGFKYEQFQGQNTSTNGHCIELETQFAGVANMDTRIYVFNGTSTIAVNNNFGGTLYSRARFWMQSSGGVGLDYIIRVRANNAATNSGAFRVKFTRRDITEAACTTGQASMPWAKMKTNANSNNWGVVTVGGNPT